MKNSFLILILVILISSCASLRERSITYMNDNPNELAKLAAIHFKPVVEYRAGETIHVRDTQYVEGDSIPCPPNEAGEVVYVRGRDKIVRDSIFRTDTLKVPNLARENELAHLYRKEQDSNLVLNTQLESAKKQRNVSLWANGFFVLLIIGRIALRKYL